MKKNKHEDDMIFEDAETYHGENDKYSFRIIVLDQLRKISSNANVEFRGGYVNTKVIPMQGGVNKVVEEYIADSREIYSNSIEFLHDILYPHFDKKMKEASDKYKDDLKKKLDKYMEDGVFTEEEKLQYRDDRVKICRDLFLALSCFLERVNYFGERSNM